MNDRSEIDDAWGELLDDESSPAPSSGDALPPPPTFTPLLAESRRADSVVDSMQNLMKADSGAVAAASAEDVAGDDPSSDASDDDRSASSSIDPSSASGSMPKLWEALWADSEPSSSASEPREEDSVAALLPAPPVLTVPKIAAAEDSGVGLRLAPPLEPEPRARIGPDERSAAAPAIEQSVELTRPPRVAEEVSPAASDGRSEPSPEAEVEDVPVRAAVAARVAEEAPARVRPLARASEDDARVYAALSGDTASTRPRTVWIGGAALLVTAAIVGFAMRGGDEGPSPAQAGNAATSAPEQAPASARAHEPEENGAPSANGAVPSAPEPHARTPEPERSAPEPSAPEPEPSEPEPSEPEPSAPEPSAPEPSVDADPSLLGAAADRPAYDAAKAEYESSGSQDALATMVEAACAMDDGPSARAAFRKLKPTELRKRTLSACNATKVDPTLSIEGFSAAELVRKARRELQAGDPAAAMSTARESNRMTRSSDAIAVMMLSACAQGDAEEARRLRKHVARDDRAEVDAACAQKGIDPAAAAD